MAHISRQELKSDEFVSSVDAALEYMLEHRDRLIALGVVAALIAVAVWGGLSWRRHREVAAEQLLGTALDTLHAPLLTAQTPNGVPRFASVTTRAQAAAAQFQQVMSGYGSTTAGQWARYYLGLAQVDEGDLAGAEKTLKAATSSGNSDVAAVAKNGLANFYLRQGKLTDARSLLLQLANQNSALLPQVVVWTELAELDTQLNPAEAAGYYRRIEATYPKTQSATQAAQALAELQH